jgi:hypothetical protein
MANYAETAAKSGPMTLRVLQRVLRSKGTVLGNFYMAIGNENAALLAATFATKDRDGKLVRRAGLDKDDREAVGAVGSIKSARGLLVCKAGEITAFVRTDLPTQGQDATDKQVRLSLRKITNTWDDLALYRKKIAVQSGDREAFDRWYETFGKPDERDFAAGELDHLADEQGVDREEFAQLVANGPAVTTILDDLDKEGSKQKLRDRLEPTLDLARGKLRELESSQEGEEFQELLDKWDDRLDSADADEWPKVERDACDEHYMRAMGLRRTNLAGAIEALRRGFEAIEARKERKEQLDAVVGRLGKYINGAREVLDDQRGIGDDPPDGWQAIEDALNLVMPKARAFRTCVEETGPWSDWLGKTGALIREAKLPFIDALNFEFRGDQSLDLSQSTFALPGSDEILLESLGNEGVCQALALDFLGSDGSGMEPGSKQHRTIETSHLQWQAAYSLQKMLGQRSEREVRKVLDMDDELPDSPETAQAMVEAAEQQIERLRRTIEEYPEWRKQALLTRQRYFDSIAENREMASDYRALALKAARAGDPREQTRLDDEADEFERLVELDIERARKRVQQMTDRSKLVEEGPEAIDKLLLQLPELRKGVLEAKERAKPYLLQMESMERRWKELSEQWELTMGSDLAIPSRMLQAFGVEMVPDTETKVRNGSNLRPDQLEVFYDNLLDGLDPDEGGLWDVSLLVGSGHAIALKAKHTSSTDSWDVEWFDPNFGAFRFTDRDRGRHFLKQLIGVNYDGECIEIRARRARKIETEDKQGTLGGEDPQYGWVTDYESALEGLESLSFLSPLPRSVIEELTIDRQRIDRQLTGSPGTLDFKVARSVLRNLVATTVETKRLHGTFTARRGDAVRRIAAFKGKATKALVPLGNSQVRFTKYGPEAGLSTLDQCFKAMEELGIE